MEQYKKALKQTRKRLKICYNATSVNDMPWTASVANKAIKEINKLLS